jgi:DNA polymerase
MLIGEAPGEQEARLGEPFRGPAGKLLKQMLKHSGVDFNSCYVTNIMNTRPPGNAFVYFYEDKSRKEPSQALLDAWQKLQDKIKRIKPNIVVCLGAEPYRAVTNRRGVEHYRGTVSTFNNIKVLCTYHPSAVLRNYDFHPIVEIDFAKVARESQFPEVRCPQPNIVLQPTLKDVLDWFDYSSSEYPILSFDIETVGEATRCIGFARGKLEQPECIVVPFVRFPESSMVQPQSNTIISIAPRSSSATSYWSKEDEIIVLRTLADVFVDSSVKKIGQNSISFDQPRLEKEFGFVVNNHSMDTMHAWHVLYPELPKSLNFLCSILTDYNDYWNDKNTEDDMSLWKYCGMDAVVTLECGGKIESELRTCNLWTLYSTHVHKLAFALARAQRRGIKVDLGVMSEIHKVCKEALDERQKAVEKQIGKEINLNSHAQVKRLLYEELGFPTVHNKDGKVSVDEEALRRLEKKYPGEPILNNIIMYRKDSKLVSTYLNPNNVDEDGRMRTSWNASGTETGECTNRQEPWC